MTQLIHYMEAKMTMIQLAYDVKKRTCRSLSHYYRRCEKKLQVGGHVDLRAYLHGDAGADAAMFHLASGLKQRTWDVWAGLEDEEVERYDPVIGLRTPYTMSGTNVGCAAIGLRTRYAMSCANHSVARRTRCAISGSGPSMVLRTRYAMSGTDLAYAAARNMTLEGEEGKDNESEGDGGPGGSTHPRP
eukprot:2331783-Rhodomonas_salina.1